MGWFKERIADADQNNASQLDAVRGRMLNILDVEVEDEGEFITLVGSVETEPVIEDSEE
jgi:hypothetical protein